MTPLGFGFLVLACLVGGTLLGLALRAAVPEHHLGGDSKDVIKLGIGLVATMAALVLGLITASTKSFFDSQEAAVKDSAANVLMLDRLLARYGSETKEIRASIRDALAYKLNATWPEDKSQSVRVDTSESTPTIEGIEEAIRALSPETDSQRWLQSKALESSGALLRTRWLVLSSVGSTVPVPFLVVLVLWLTIIFSTFGLIAPRNGTVLCVLFVCAVSVSAAIFLILEMSQPFDGLMKVSGEPLRYALSHLGQ